MSELTKNDEAWNTLFEHFNILDEISTKGNFVISSDSIKNIGQREPRLMSKFDHSVNLPKIFSDNKLAILPISRGDYVISKFEAYHKFELNSAPIQKFSLPDHLQSLNGEYIPSEAIAINAALASGMLNDFFEDDELYPTVCGRMGSGDFNFSIKNKDGNDISLDVKNSQIEIDAAYEGINYLSLVEAKKCISEDFLVRQLYYPYRTWKEKGITKKIKPVFMVYSNGVFSFYEYTFTSENSYNSLVLSKAKRYSIENTEVNVDDIVNLLDQVQIVEEPKVAFPQADKFERVVNLCELLNVHPYTQEQITQQYAFDVRQTNYYADAAQYLGLVKKAGTKGPYTITTEGRRILNLPYKRRQLAFCEKIIQHKPFYESLKQSLEKGSILEKDSIVTIMQSSHIYNVESDSTFKRRASTIRGWINWIFALFSP